MKWILTGERDVNWGGEWMITLSYGVTHTSCDWPSELFGVIRCTITEGPDYFFGATVLREKSSIS